MWLRVYIVLFSFICKLIFFYLIYINTEIIMGICIFMCTCVYVHTRVYVSVCLHVYVCSNIHCYMWFSSTRSVTYNWICRCRNTNNTKQIRKFLFFSIMLLSVFILFYYGPESTGRVFVLHVSKILNLQSSGIWS